MLSTRSGVWVYDCRNSLICTKLDVVTAYAGSPRLGEKAACHLCDDHLHCNFSRVFNISATFSTFETCSSNEQFSDNWETLCESCAHSLDFFCFKSSSSPLRLLHVQPMSHVCTLVLLFPCNKYNIFSISLYLCRSLFESPCGTSNLCLVHQIFWPWHFWISPPSCKPLSMLFCITRTPLCSRTKLTSLFFSVPVVFLQSERICQTILSRSSSCIIRGPLTRCFSKTKKESIVQLQWHYGHCLLSQMVCLHNKLTVWSTLKRDSC